MKTKSPALGPIILLVLSLCLASGTAASVETVAIRPLDVEPPAAGGGESGNSILSPDGRFVLFSSTAGNLVSTSSNTPFASYVPDKMNVFLRDRTGGTNLLVSVNTNGIGGNGDSISGALSTNSQFALFESGASDLVNGDTNNANDIFVRDLVNGTTVLVSASTNGGCANGESRDAVMTPDGRYVAFVSLANNLVPDDTNRLADVFVRDLIGGTTVLASPGAEQAFRFCSRHIFRLRSAADHAGRTLRGVPRQGNRPGFGSDQPRGALPEGPSGRNDDCRERRHACRADRIDRGLQPWVERRRTTCRV